MSKERSSGNYTIDFHLLHLSVRWNTVLYPFEQRKFLSLLPGEGYIVEEEALQRPPLGSFPEVSGPIARKGKTTLRTETSRAFVAIEAEDAETLITDFDKIEELLREQLLFDSSQNALFYELLSQGIVWSEANPLQTMSKVTTDSPLLHILSRAAGFGPLRNVSLRLIKDGSEPRSEDWFDFHVEPSTRSPYHAYRFVLVFRQPNKPMVIDFAQRLSTIITETIRSLEHANE